MANKFVASFSGGKDSMLSVAKQIEAGWEAVALMNTSRETNTSWFHCIPKELLQAVADSMEIPLKIINTKGGSEYAPDFEAALKHYKETEGISGCVYGDIDLQAHRDWCEERCHPLGLEAIFPLWQKNRVEVVKEFINRGFKAVIVVVNTKLLSADFIGKELTLETIEKIAEYGADPCGENGEFHTFVYDGPVFKKPVNFILSEEQVIDHYVIRQPMANK